MIEEQIPTAPADQIMQFGMLYESMFSSSWCVSWCETSTCERSASFPIID